MRGTTTQLFCIAGFFARESGLGRGVRRHAGYIFFVVAGFLGGPF